MSTPADWTREEVAENLNKQAQILVSDMVEAMRNGESLTLIPQFAQAVVATMREAAKRLSE